MRRRRRPRVPRSPGPSTTRQVVRIRVEYAYDGDSNRLRQIDNTSTSPITTTYTNDIIGLTQVLVAGDGTDHVHNLFGLDLILQHDDNEVRTLLADGLGSVRQEIVDGLVEAATTYSPYGEVLTQAGTSGTMLLICCKLPFLLQSGSRNLTGG